MKKRGFLLCGSNENLTKKPNLLLISLFEKAGYEMESYVISDIDVICSEYTEGTLYMKEEKVTCPDFAVIAADVDDYVTAVVKMLEGMGILCINSFKGITYATDKLLCQQEMIEKLVGGLEGVHLPKTILVTGRTSARFLGEQLSYPVILKVMHGKKGKGVVMAKDEKELSDMLGMVTAADFGDQIIAQEAIMTSKGRDVRTMICNGKFTQSFIRSARNSDFRSNVAQGGEVLPYEAPEHLKRASEKIAQELGLAVGSVDFMFGASENEFYFCEANSMPGILWAEILDPGHMVEQIKKLIDEYPVPAWKEK